MSPVIADELAAELFWSPQHREEAVTRYRRELDAVGLLSNGSTGSPDGNHGRRA